MNIRALHRTTDAPPVRIVHIGLGAFHRSHQAWYTQHATDGADWGIAAFTVRSPDAARALAAQDGLYTIVVRGPEGDTAELGTAISRAIDGADLGEFVTLLADPGVAVVTLTVTEAGYALDPHGEPHQELLDDVATGSAATVIGRLLIGLDARRHAGVGGIALVSCDNLPENGAYLRHGLLSAARARDGKLAEWIEENVGFVATSVDRITPEVTAELRRTARDLTGCDDAAPVVTEPFSDWVLSGSFPAGRPAWETAGARFVDDLRPWERRKLWMLNGAHTLLALAGPARGHTTVAEAIRDPDLRRAVELLWDDCAGVLPSDLELETYREALAERFENERIEHRLAQVARDSTHKVSLRIVPVGELRIAAGESANGCAFAIAAWIAVERPDSAAYEAVRELSSTLAGSDEFLARVTLHLSTPVGRPHVTDVLPR